MNLYLSRGPAPYTPPTIRGAWDDTASAITGALYTTRAAGGVITSIQVAEATTTGTWDVLLFRGVSPPMAAQTLTGNFDLMYGVDETSLSADMVYHLYVYVTQGDTDTPRGVLINDYIDATEWPTTSAGRALAAAQAYGPLAVFDGDRIVVEIGYQAQNVSSTSFSGRLFYGTQYIPFDTPAIHANLLVAGNTNTTQRSGYLSFSNDITFITTQAVGVSSPLRGGSLGFTGFSGLTPTVSPPAGVELNDILIIGLAHKSGGWATFPVDWTLLAQEVEGGTGIRGEVYWKRAVALEQLNTYSITGLSDTACGTIRYYRNCVQTGSPVDAVLTKASPFSVGFSTVGSLTPTVDNALVGLFVATSANTASNGTGKVDPNIDIRPGIVQQSTDLTGTDCHCAMVETLNPLANVPTGDLTWNTGSTALASIFFSLIPQTTVALRNGTRYIIGANQLGRAAWRSELLKGTWSYLRGLPGGEGMQSRIQTLEMSQVIARDGVKGLTETSSFSVLDVATDQPDAFINVARLVTPQLDAQTIDGTIDLCFLSGAAMNDSASFPLDSYKVRWKLHVYISVGDTAAVRTVLLDNHIDGTDFPVSEIWRGLTAPQTLTSAACLAGDRVVVELGIWNRALPTVPPTYPPGLWGYTAIRFVGTAPQQTLVPFPEAEAGSGLADLASYVQFSHEFVEQAPAAGPTNITPALARNIATLPYTEALYSTRNAGVPASAVWYKFTAPQTKRYFFTTLGSNYDAFIGIYSVEPPPYTAASFSEWIATRGGLAINRCDNMAILDAIGGHEYYLRVINESNGMTPLPGGGELQLSAYEYQLPEDNDLYVPCRIVYAIRDGVIVNISPLFTNTTNAGIAIDFSRTPMYDFNTSAVTNVDPRIYIGLFGSPLVEIIDGYSMNPIGPEVNYIADAIDPAGGGDTGGRNITTLDIADGQLFVGFSGDGYQLVNGTNPFVGAFLNNVSSDVWKDAIRECDRMATSGDATPPPSTLRYQAAPQITAPWHIRVNPSNTDLIYYTSGGYYTDECLINSVPVSLRCDTIKVWSRTGGQQADFAVVPLATGPHEGIYGIDIHPNGDVLVCNGNRVDRLNSAGSVVQSYIPNDLTKANALQCVRYTAQGLTFWVFDLDSSTLWHFRISDGAILQRVDLLAPSWTTTQMAIWLEHGIVPPPDCPGIAVGPRIDGLSYPLRP